MTPHEVLIVAAMGAGNVIYIGLRALQQRNVQHENRLAIYPTSMLMAVGDFFNPTIAAWSGIRALAGDASWLMPVCIILAWGIGGGLGSNLAITFHKKYNGKEKH